MGRKRRIATVAAQSSGAIGAAGLLAAGALAGLMFGETKVAERRIPKAVTDPPVSNGTTWAAAGVSARRPPLRLAVLGDSLAAGYGVHRDRDTPAAQLAIGISDAARRPVHITNVALVGAESTDLPRQLEALGRARADLAVVFIGANDVTERTKPADPARLLADTVHRLRATGAEVVVGTCPDLGTIRPLPQPLRWYARRASRQLAKAQTVAVVKAGGRTVSLGDLLGPLFATRLDLFSDDQFHPSAAGYAEAAAAVLPSCLDALGLRTLTESASTFTTTRAKPIAKAAAQAAAHPGTEVAATERRGIAVGRPHTLARLRRRRPARPEPPSIEAAEPVNPATVI